MSQFSQPAIASPEDKFVASEHNGALLLFFPTGVQLAVATAHGTADAVNTRVVNLENGRVLENTLIFATALVTQLKPAAPDGMVLGRLGQGQNTKGNPPWLLSPHTDADVARAEQWLAANPRNQFAQPQTQAAPPTAPAWNAPATQEAPAWGGTPAPVAAPAAPSVPSWQAPAPAPVAAPVVDPGLVEALRKKGVAVPPGANQQTAELIWASVANNPDVA